MAVGIVVADYISVPPGALFLLLLSSLLLLAALWQSRRGAVALTSLSLFFILVGYMRAFLPEVSLLPASLLSWSGSVGHLLLQALDRMGLSSSASSLLKAMLLGRRADLSPDVVELYRQTGASHILALSGLHLTILLGLFNFCFLRLLAFRWRYVVGGVGIFLIWGYALLVGFPVSLCRASLMMSFLILGQMRLTGYSAWHSLGLTAFLLILVNPYSLFDVGFQLSFMAVAGLLLFYPLLAGIGLPQPLMARRMWQVMLTSLAAQLGVMPLLLHYFHRFSVMGILLSPVYILLATAIIHTALLLCLLAPLGLAFLIRPLVEMLVAAQHGLMSLAARWPWDGAGEVCFSWGCVVLCYAAWLCMVPPLYALRRPEEFQPVVRWVRFFRLWPYVLAAVMCLLAAYLLR